MRKVYTKKSSFEYCRLKIYYTAYTTYTHTHSNLVLVLPSILYIYPALKYVIFS